MSDVFVKICGLKNSHDVSVATSEGANAVGFILATEGPRSMKATEIPPLIRGLDQGVESVGVFRNQPIDEVLELATLAHLSTIQLHGDETYEELMRCQAAGFRTFRAFSVAAYLQLDDSLKKAYERERILIDAIHPGSGQTFDPSLLGSERPRGFWLLAGGLTPANVQGMIETLNPSGVDVSSGVESSRGIKDPELIRDFLIASRS